MRRKNRTKNHGRPAKSLPQSSKKTSKASDSAASPKPIKVNPMDIFRAQDQASKAAVKKMATIDGFDNFLTRVGLNNDNSFSDSTYTFNLITRNRTLIEAAYRGSWIVGQVIDTVAEDMTRAGIDITTSAKDDINVLEKEMTRLQIWQSVRNNIAWGRMYGGAIGVLQIEGQDLKTPLRIDTVAKGQFKGIVVYDRWMLNPVMTPVIETGPDMGLPKFYQLVNSPSSYDPTAATNTGQLTVHHSRVIRYTGIDLPWFQAITEMMWGESVLERLWDRLISFDNATLSAAQLIDRANNRTVGVDGLREIIAAGGEAQRGLEGQFAMMRFMQSNEGLTLLDKEDTFQTTAYSFAGLSDMMLQFGQQLAGASGIPLVRLFGQSPQGMNATGEGDMRMYYDNINAQQEAKLRNSFSVLLKVLWRSTFGVAEPPDLDFSFTPLWQLSAVDKANVAKTNTDTITEAYTAGLVTTSVAMKELKNSSGDTGIFSNITEEDIAEAELEPAPLPDEPGEEDKSSEEKPEEKKDDKKTKDRKSLIAKFNDWMDSL